jgi:hypothetical protein
LFLSLRLPLRSFFYNIRLPLFFASPQHFLQYSLPFVFRFAVTSFFFPTIFAYLLFFASPLHFHINVRLPLFFASLSLRSFSYNNAYLCF